MTFALTGRAMKDGTEVTTTLKFPEDAVSLPDIEFSTLAKLEFGKAQTWCRQMAGVTV